MLHPIIEHFIKRTSDIVPAVKLCGGSLLVRGCFAASGQLGVIYEAMNSTRKSGRRMSVFFCIVIK